jgi:hypothetical protein
MYTGSLMMVAAGACWLIVFGAGVGAVVKIAMLWVAATKLLLPGMGLGVGNAVEQPPFVAAAVTDDSSFR